MNGNVKTKTLADLIEVNRDDQALDVIGGNGHDATPSRKVSEPEFAGDRHVFGLMADGCRLLNGFRYYDETTGWPLNPSAERKKYLTLAELFAVKENLTAALEHKPDPAVRQQIEQAKRIVLAALGEMESE